MAVLMMGSLGRLLTELRWEPAPYRLRAYVDDTVVLDTRTARLVWEPRRVVPVFGIPPADLYGTVEPVDPQPPRADLDALPPVLGPERFDPHTSPGSVVEVVVGDRRIDGFVPDDPDLGGVVLVDFNGFDAWRTEDQVLIGHARDPFKRIDVMPSGRHVVISLDGQVLADSRRARLLLETPLPGRWYVPTADVRMDLLEESPGSSVCAYKGLASYLSVTGGERDVAWQYVAPLNDAVPVKDHVCFWSERTDLVLDGDPVPRPETPWSRRD